MYRDINKNNIPDWALNRAKGICDCGWTLHDLRAANCLSDSYVYTIFRVAQHVMETEEEPRDPLFETIHNTLCNALHHTDTHKVSGWPGTVVIAAKITDAIRNGDLRNEDFRP